MNYSLNGLYLNYFTSKYNTYDTNRFNTEYDTSQKEPQDIFSPINPNPTNLNDINILELSSLRNNINPLYGIKVKKLNPYLTTDFFPNKNFNPNKKTLVLDLDETLVHSSTEKPFPNQKNIILNLKIKNKPYKIYAILRPYLDFFLKEMSVYYNLYIFTASLSQYSTALLNILDKNRLIIRSFNREHCQYKFGLYFKDLSIFNIDYKNIIIIDNNPVSYALNKSNGIPIQTWIDDPHDKELIKLIPLLKYLSKVDDVRIMLKKIINRAKAKVNFTLFNKLLKNDSKNNLGQDKEKNNTHSRTNTNILQKKSNSKIILDEKGNINLLSANLKNINNEYTSKKLKVKKYVKEKIPEDKIKTKKEETNTKPNIFNISIENIKNIKNNIQIVLKDKNEITVSKLNKPKNTIKKINTFQTGKIKSININKTVPNMKVETISKSLILKNPLSPIKKKPLDKNEDEIGIQNNLNLYKNFPKKETLNLIDENLIRTNVFFNNTLIKKHNYFNINEPYKHYRPASKPKLIVMKIIRKKQNRNDNNNSSNIKFNNTLK
jgi:Dullard-like phosphatase family protein